MIRAQAAGKGMCGKDAGHTRTKSLQPGSAATHCISSSRTKHASSSIAWLASRCASAQPWQWHEHVQAMIGQRCLLHVQARHMQRSFITAEHHGGHHYWLLAEAELSLRRPVDVSRRQLGRGLLMPAQSRHKPTQSPSAAQGPSGAFLLPVRTMQALALRGLPADVHLRSPGSGTSTSRQ